MPLMEDDEDIKATPVSLIWENEVKGVNNRVMMFEHIERADIAEIKVIGSILALGISGAFAIIYTKGVGMNEDYESKR